MIIRIHMEDQYRLNDEATDEVDKLDKALLVAVDNKDANAFTSELRTLLSYVRAHGEKVPTEEIIPSDLILPSEDMTLAEASTLMEKGEAAASAEAAGTSQAEV